MLLPFFILLNLYQVYMANGGSNFLGISWLGNWENSFFGFSSLLRVVTDLGNFDWSQFVNHLKMFVNDALPFRTVYDNFKIYQNAGLSTLLEWFWNVITFFVTLFNLMIAPILTGIDGVFILLDVLSYLVSCIEILYRAVGGYYNVTASGLDNGWNDLSHYVYTM